jgi:Cu/Ag efflux protein CusF
MRLAAGAPKVTDESLSGRTSCMTMTFKAAPAVTRAVKRGDKVNFDVKLIQGERWR